MSPLPTSQVAVQFTGPDQLVLNRAKPVDVVGPTQLLLQVEACGICFSDSKLLHAFDAHPRKGEVQSGLSADELDGIPSYRPGSEATVPGHEPVARVAAVGDQVRRHRVGDRVLVQADWRHLPTAESNSAFGYNFEGALQEYVLVDERIVSPAGGGDFLLPVSAAPSAAAVGLVEPWATVEAAYSRRERTALTPGGRLLVVVGGGVVPSGLAALLCTATSARVVVCGDIPALSPVAERVQSIEELAGSAFDDIVYFGSEAAVIEDLAALLATRGVICVVLAGATIERPVRLDVSRVHYDLVRYIGTCGESPCDAYARIPLTGEIRAGDRVLVIGAAGPMGLMHTVRTVVLGVEGVAVDAADVNDDRLANLAAVVGPFADRHGVPVRIINSLTSDLSGGYGYVTCLVPSPALLAQAVDLAGEGSIVNAFAGFPAGTLADLDLQGIIERGVFLTGSSGSDLDAMRTVLQKVESGILDTTISLDAITGLAGVADAIGAVANRTSGGKIMVYPQLHDQRLVRLVDLPAELPHVAAHLDNGRWCRAAEDALLAGRDPEETYR